MDYLSVDIAALVFTFDIPHGVDAASFPGTTAGLVVAFLAVALRQRLLSEARKK